MDHVELNAELRDFCKQLISDGYSKSQICSIILGQQKMPMFSQFLENETRNFGIGVLSQIFDIFGYKLEIVPVLKTEKNEPIETVNVTENNNKFVENYHLLMSEGLANQETMEHTRESKVSTAITDIAMNMFQNIKF